ncbi:MAG: hypothetical protein ABIO69_00790 [Sphingomicrobium sp.]
MAAPETPKPIVVNVGVTGHRAGALTAPLVRTLRPVIYSVLRQLRAAVLRIQLAEPLFCSATEARLLLHTGLASGADQIAALCARSSGYGVRALLPFEASNYSNDFARGEELESFEQALAAADEIVALPGHRSDLEGAYVRVGESLVRTADVLVAIWDGERGRGRGGTAHVVELALQSSVPVLHIDIDRGSDKVQMRALIDGEAIRPFGRSVHDPDLYNRLLYGALRLDPAPAVASAGVLANAAHSGGRA